MTDVTRRDVLCFAGGVTTLGGITGIVLHEVVSEDLSRCDEQRSHLGGVQLECENGSDST